ncbi:hypothetical protein BKA62DRAFT_686392 [Auriculariales sp. MPI-PUGE-AT-0066]|nr:hypothetical protein BKA62DRAFT_686392 [Auriculariales sp. MPI-PUGE-AT-0066]
MIAPASSSSSLSIPFTASCHRTPSTMNAPDYAEEERRLLDDLEGITHSHAPDVSRDDFVRDAVSFCHAAALSEHVRDFERGAHLVFDPTDWDAVPSLTSAERQVLEREHTHIWDQPFPIFFIAICSSLAAVVQGMDEAVVNGAQVFYYEYFGIENPDDDGTIAFIQGMVNSAPYLCCFVLSCWLTGPLNNLLARRGTIFLCCIITIIASFMEAVTQTWRELFFARVVLGLAIGPISATAPVYTSECAPAAIRGALTMQWQMWTAFGILAGQVVCVLLKSYPPNLAWRLMLGSTFFVPIIVCALIITAPESPRWCMLHGKPKDAMKAMLRLRKTPLQAARDLYLMHRGLVVDAAVHQQDGEKAERSKAADLWRVPRVRRAALASGILMFMQQFCGVNVIAYYSSQVFVESGFSRDTALLATMGTGVLSWLFAIPAMYTIDSFGRRNLVLVSLPVLGLCLAVTALGFQFPLGDVRLATVASSLYVFMIAYGPGMGPVPFAYSAEAFPLYIRDFGMSFATATCWGFNFVLAMTFPPMLARMGPTGAFAYYSVWCLIGWVLVFLLVPETMARSLEELDSVFEVHTRVHAKWQIRRLVVGDAAGPEPLGADAS